MSSEGSDALVLVIGIPCDGGSGHDAAKDVVVQAGNVKVGTLPADDVLGLAVVHEDDGRGAQEAGGGEADELGAVQGGLVDDPCLDASLGHDGPDNVGQVSEEGPGEGTLGRYGGE